MGWLAERFITNYNSVCVENTSEYLSPEETLKNERDWLDRKMKDRLYPILDKMRYGYLKLEDVDRNNFENFHGAFVEEEWNWFNEKYRKP